MPNRFVYVVMRKEWEYNDEGYSQNDGGVAETAFTEQPVAEARALEENMRWLSGLDSDDGYDLEFKGGYSTDYNREECAEFLNSIAPGCASYDRGLTYDFSKLTDEQLREVASQLEDPTYYVSEVLLQEA